MNKLNYFLILLGVVLFTTSVEARGPHTGPGGTANSGGNNGSLSTGSLRAACVPSTAKENLDVNNVRALLVNSGDLFLDYDNTPRYIVPKVDPTSGEPEVSSIYSAAVWIGGQDEANNLVLAAQTYRSSEGVDFWPGPLEFTPGSIGGVTEQAICLKWDRMFTVSGTSIRDLRADYLSDDDNNGVSDFVVNDPIPSDLLQWPGRGNPYFAQQFPSFGPLPDIDLAPFIDANGDGIYDPQDGDHPIIEVRGCDKADYNKAVFADQMTWWVYNDNGDVHGTGASPIFMEVQVTAFAYATSDAINNMTFYRYKLINKNALTLRNTYFSLWNDPDLGCADDDYIGCDTTYVGFDSARNVPIGRDFGYVYNQNAFDDDCNGNPGYGNKVPALGVDYFRGPLGNEVDPTVDPADWETLSVSPLIIDTAFSPVGLSSFTYFVNGGSAPLVAMSDPDNAAQYYNYMSGRWRDGTVFASGGDGYSNTNGIPTRYAFPGTPNDNTAWSMCQEGTAENDFRFIHSSGPFTLFPSKTNELIAGYVWVPQANYPCPDLSNLFRADDLAQGLFDNCFKIVDGPDAPFMDIVELENALVLSLRNTRALNNFNLDYTERDPSLPTSGDQNYNFQGYKIYQLKDANVSFSELDDPEQARLIAQTDIKDGVSKIVNWEPTDELDQVFMVPIERVDGANEGIKNTFLVTEDQFALNDKKLVNHKKYHFVVVAYGYNTQVNDPSDPNLDLTTPNRPFLQGRRNVMVYEGIPRITDTEYAGLNLNAVYGSSPEITRYDGEGSGGAFLTVKNYESVEEDVIANGDAEVIVYDVDHGPFEVNVYNPLKVAGGTYRLRMFDNSVMSGGNIDPFAGDGSMAGDETFWILENTDGSGQQVMSYQDLSVINEYVVDALGISISTPNLGNPGTTPLETSGYVGPTETTSSIAYRGEPANWLLGIQDGVATQEFVTNGFVLPTTIPVPGYNEIFDVMKTNTGEDYFLFDRFQEFSDGNTGFFPLPLLDCNLRTDPGDPALGLPPTPLTHFSPNFINDSYCNLIDQTGIETLMENLRNVNIVLTPDRSKWSRCLVLETASEYFTSPAPIGQELPTPDGTVQWDIRAGTSLDSNYEPTSGTGYSYFPGYAYDVTTGQRLNILFGENTLFNDNFATALGLPDNGDDMIFNPSDLLYNDLGSDNILNSIFEFPLGGMHQIFVDKNPYDECATLKGYFDGFPANIAKLRMGRDLIWAGNGVLAPGFNMEDGVPLSEAVIRLRVNNPYDVAKGTDRNNGYPDYEFTLTSLREERAVQETAENALDLINVVPNPYYAYSDYENNELERIIKITNIPGTANINIYSIDGRLVRTYKRAEVVGETNGVEKQILTSVNWDLDNYAGTPVAGGVYLIHVAVPNVGERVVKAFIVNRSFDSQKL